MIELREPLPWRRDRPQLVARLSRWSFAQLPRAEFARCGNSVRKLRLRHPKRVVGAERSPGWYDKKFSRTSTYQASYQDSPYYFLWSLIVDRLRRDGAGRVLEIGCGGGQLAAFLLEHKIERYVPMEFSPKASEYAREAAPGGLFVVDGRPYLVQSTSTSGTSTDLHRRSWSSSISVERCRNTAWVECSSTVGAIGRDGRERRRRGATDGVGGRDGPAGRDRTAEAAARARRVAGA
jgi:hypothetical protein